MMKAMYRNIFIALLIGLFAGSCEKAPENGNIEGFWQLLEYTTETDGEVHACDRIYYAIQLQVAELSEKGGKQDLPTLKGLYHYDEAANVVTIKDLYYKTKDGAYKTPNEKQLKGYGLDKPDMELEVLKADGKYLILKSDYATLTLKRF